MLAAILKFGLAALGFLDKLFAFLNTQAAKKAGADEEKVRQNEVDNQAKIKASAVKDNVVNLDDATLAKRLRKYQRKDV